MSANRLKLNADKKELLWAGTKHDQHLLTDCGPSLQLDADSVVACEHVRLLGVTISSDLGLYKHVSNICVKRLNLLAAPTPTCPAITRRRSSDDIGSRLRDVPCGHSSTPSYTGLMFQIE